MAIIRALETCPFGGDLGVEVRTDSKYCIDCEYRAGEDEAIGRSPGRYCCSNDKRGIGLCRVSECEIQEFVVG
jgi:hypothetical protein